MRHEPCSHKQPDTMKSQAALLTRAEMANMAWWTQRYASSFWHMHLSLHCQLSKCHNSGIFLMLLESSNCWISHLSFIFEKTIKQISSGSEARNQIFLKVCDFKDHLSVLGTRHMIFQLKVAMLGRRHSQETPSPDTQNTCSAYHDWSQLKKTGLVWGMYMCNISTPNVFSTQENLGGGETHW